MKIGKRATHCEDRQVLTSAARVCPPPNTDKCPRPADPDASDKFVCAAREYTVYVYCEARALFRIPIGGTRAHPMFITFGLNDVWYLSFTITIDRWRSESGDCIKKKILAMFFFNLCDKIGWIEDEYVLEYVSRLTLKWTGSVFFYRLVLNFGFTIERAKVRIFIWIEL